MRNFCRCVQTNDDSDHLNKCWYLKEWEKEKEMELNHAWKFQILIKAGGNNENTSKD